MLIHDTQNTLNDPSNTSAHYLYRLNAAFNTMGSNKRISEFQPWTLESNVYFMQFELKIAKNSQKVVTGVQRRTYYF